MAYQPYGKTKTILDRAMEHVQSVRYKVSLRWVFYRLLQEGLYRNKKDYGNFVTLTSRARKSWYNAWAPDTLTDETREMDVFTWEGDPPHPDLDELIQEGYRDALGELAYFKDQLENYESDCAYSIDPNYYQDTICVILFEARAMSQQFQTYTRGLTLCPFGGQPSIPFKWRIAKWIEAQCRIYEKPATVLYFGDCDDAGTKIFNAGREDITAWCKADVSFVFCGLTEEQAQHYNVPENFEAPGSYQWEALTDDQARKIITRCLTQYHDLDAENRALRETREIRMQVNEAVDEMLQAGKE